MQLFAELARISKYYGGSVSLSTPWLMRCAKGNPISPEKCSKNK